MEGAAKEGQSPGAATSSAHAALLGKTTMFSPGLLMGNGKSLR